MRTVQNIAVAFFGIPRSVKYTLGSIEDNVLTPARKRGRVRTFAHFFDQMEIDNPRSQEKGSLDPNDAALLNIDDIHQEPPHHCQTQWNFPAVHAYGDHWGDGFHSLSNLFHQLHSLHNVTTRVLEQGYEVCIFARPDLRYHDTLSSVLRRLRPNRDRVYVPGWQQHRGVNDRFAVCVGANAIRAYGHRAELAQTYCETFGKALHSERLLGFALEKHGIPRRNIGVRATRIRLDGRAENEDFGLYPDRFYLKRAMKTLRIR